MTNKTTQTPPAISPTIVLFFGIIAISFSAILIRWVQEEQVPSLVIAAWRMIFSGAILWPLAWVYRREELKQLDRISWGWGLLAGFMLAVHFASWVSSLEYTTVVSSTVLVTTSPLWVALLSPFFLGEQLTRPLKIGIGLAVAGSLIIGIADAGTDGLFAGANPMWGNFLALVGAWMAGGYLLIGRKLRPNLSLLSYTAVVYGTSALCLSLFVLLSPYSFDGYSARAFILCFLMALFPQLLGHTSYNWALGFFPAAYISITIVSEAVGATLLALLFFAEVPTPLVILGGVFILGGIVVASRK